jgi:hypothetical protein
MIYVTDSWRLCPAICFFVFYGVPNWRNTPVFNPSLKAASWVATRVLRRILWNPMTYFHVCMSPTLSTILSHMNPVLITPQGPSYGSPATFRTTCSLWQKPANHLCAIPLHSKHTLRIGSLGRKASDLPQASFNKILTHKHGYNIGSVESKALKDQSRGVMLWWSGARIRDQD